MSVWIVTKRHIDLLVTALYRFEVVTPADGTPDAIGQTLWDENFASVNYRYDETDTAPAYVHNSSSVQAYVRQPIYVYVQTRCYAYQSCEHPAWEQSRAATWMARLQQAICTGLQMSPEAIAGSPAWYAVPWGLDDVTVAEAEPV